MTYTHALLASIALAALILSGSALGHAIHAHYTRRPREARAAGIACAILALLGVAILMVDV